MLRCPCCRTELHPVPVVSGGVSMCHACAGAWVDTAHSIGLARGIVSAEFEQAMLRAEVDALRLAGAGGYRHPPAESTRSCAECGAPLARAVVNESEVVVDACGVHGTWFDAGELLALAHHFEAKAVRDHADVQRYADSIAQSRQRAGLLDVVIALFDYVRERSARDRT
ncbi:MAG: zf-TFIIB domain-containing protein [Deltaproteobacteria bacterium]|nr:zf-TFIIB domain-containing protein [Deltaproteobacteria bacterium]